MKGRSSSSALLADACARSAVARLSLSTCLKAMSCVARTLRSSSSLELLMSLQIGSQVVDDRFELTYKLGQVFDPLLVPPVDVVKFT